MITAIVFCGEQLHSVRFTWIIIKLNIVEDRASVSNCISKFNVDVAMITIEYPVTQLYGNVVNLCK